MKRRRRLAWMVPVMALSLLACQVEGLPWAIARRSAARAT